MAASAPWLVLMALAVLAALAYPLLAGGARDRRVVAGPSELDALLRRKAMLYQNMKDLEFEYQMGKLSEADYERLREEDRAEAARILAEIDALEDRDDPDAIIEREIAAREGGARGGLGDPSPAAERRRAAVARPARPSPAGALAPPAASRAPEAPAARPARESRPAEAAAVPEPAREVSFCSACGARVRPGDHFCSRCGSPLSVEGAP